MSVHIADVRPPGAGADTTCIGVRVIGVSVIGINIVGNVIGANVIIGRRMVDDIDGHLSISGPPKLAAQDSHQLERGRAAHLNKQT